MSLRFSPVVQISLSTAEDSANYFTGHVQATHQPVLPSVMPAGLYRIVDDQLFQIVEAPRAPRVVAPKP